MRYVFEKVLDGVHRCSSKIQIYIFERSRWIVGWGAPVQFQNPDIYFSKVTLDRWMGCTGAGPRVPH